MCIFQSLSVLCALLDMSIGFVQLDLLLCLLFLKLDDLPHRLFGFFLIDLGFGAGLQCFDVLTDLFRVHRPLAGLVLYQLSRLGKDTVESRDRFVQF